MGEMDEHLREYVADYRINLLCPSNIEDFDKFRTELGEVLEFIKYSGDSEALERALDSNRKFRSLGRKSVELINTVTSSKLEIPKGRRRVDVCKAIEQMKAKAVEEVLKKAEAEKTEALKKAEAEKVQALKKAEESSAERSITSAIQKMMKNMKITAEQAMETLEIPIAEQSKYLAKL